MSETQSSDGPVTERVSELALEVLGGNHLYEGYVPPEEIWRMARELIRQRETERQLETLAAKWRQRAIDSSNEAERIRRTVKAPTEAEDRCITRAEVYVMCADELEPFLNGEP